MGVTSFMGCASDRLYIERFDSYEIGSRPDEEPPGHPDGDVNILGPTGCTRSPTVDNQPGITGSPNRALLFDRPADDVCFNFMWAVSKPVTVIGGKRWIQFRVQKFDAGRFILTFGHRDLIYLLLILDDGEIFWEAQANAGANLEPIGRYEDGARLNVQMYFASNRTWGITIWDFDRRREIVSRHGTFDPSAPEILYQLIDDDRNFRLYLRAAAERGPVRVFLDEISILQLGSEESGFD